MPPRTNTPVLFAAAVLVGLSLLSPALAQQAQPSKPKTKKVWTNQDLRNLRKPWDQPADQKAPAAQPGTAPENSSEKAAPASKEEQQLRDPYVPPKTLEEAGARITEKREEIRGQEELIQRTREEYANERNEAVRRDLEKKIARLTADLKEAEAHLKLLEASLDGLRPKPQLQQP